MKSARKKILLVEDDADFATAISDLLAEWYETLVCLNPKDSESVAKALRSGKPDAILLDLHLPALSGQSILQHIRTVDSEIPVLFLTSDQTLQSKIAGLKNSADDYLDKAMDPQEIAARIECFLARRQMNKVSGGIIFDEETLAAQLGQAVINLTRTEFALLRKLCQFMPEMVPREELLAAAWPKRTVDERTLNTHIYNLRKKIRDSFGLEISGAYAAGYKISKP